MQLFQPEEVIVERGSEASPIYRNLRNALPLIPFRTVDAVSTENGRTDFSAFSFGAAKKRLFLTRHKGEFLKKCPGSDGQVCCNYFVINFASNCPMDCSYCYLQEYLADNSELKVFSNVDDLLTEAEELLTKHRRFFFRIGTGEITDSLALDPYIGFTSEIVPFFAEQPNVLLELKTKSDCVEGLLVLDPKDRVVVSWSMNPQRVIDLDEHGTASLSERLLAARRCQDAGYRLGFHFDPIVEYPNWESDYEEALDQTFGVKTKSYLQVYTSVIRLTEILHAQASVPSQEVCLYLQAIDRCEHAQNRRRCHSHGPLEHRTPTSVRHANTPLRPMRLRLQLLSPKTALPLLKETTRIRLCFRLP